jgi:hypothetical protein
MTTTDYSFGLFPEDDDDDKRDRRRFIKYLLFVILFLMGLWFYITEVRPKINRTEQDLNENIEQALEIKRWRDRSERENAMIYTLTQQNIALAAKYDTTVAKLQKEVEKYKKDLKKGGNVTITNVETKASGSSKTDSIVYIITDSQCPDIGYVDSITQFNGWITGTITARKDSTHISNLHIKHEFSIVNGYESNGLFKKRTPYTLLTSTNPYDSIVDLKSYNTVIPKPNKLNIFGIGITLGVVTTLLLLK